MTRKRRRTVSRRGFSLAALLLVIAIIAISLAVVRAAFERWPRDLAGDQTNAWQNFVAVVVSSGLLGGLFAFVLAAWRRAPIAYVLASPWLGLFVGAGGAALATIPVPWPVVCAVPAVLVLCGLVLARPKRTT